MKLVKYILFIAILIISIIFIIKLNELNMIDNKPVKIKFQYISSLEGYDKWINVCEAIILTLSTGVFIGFIIALFQMIAQKSEIMTLKSNIRRLKSLRSPT